jgi:tol-pal system protein YbgF
MLGQKQKGAFRCFAGGGQIVEKRRETQCPGSGIYFCCLFLVVSCLLPACVTVQEVDMLRQDINRLQRDNVAVKSELDQLKEKTTTSASEESFNVIRQSQAEIQSGLVGITREMQVLSGRFDENKDFTEKSLRNAAMELDLIRAQTTTSENQIREAKGRLNTLEAQIKQVKEAQKEQPKNTEKKAEEPQKAPAAEEKTVKAATPAANTAKTKYDAALKLYKAKKYKAAREKLGAFLKEFPKDQLADNALFWTAEAYYKEKDFEGAIAEYAELLKSYPDSAKAPAALLKQGYALIELHDKKGGKIILEQLVERYPKSREAMEAQKKLKELNRTTRKPVKKKKR